jgi:hypothetical protein
MIGAVMTIARYPAREAVKAQLRAQGIKLIYVESCEPTRAANRYVEDHPEIISFATARYQDLVKITEGNGANERPRRYR